MSALVVPVESYAVAPVTVQLGYSQGREPMVELTIGVDSSGCGDGPARSIGLDHHEARAIAAALIHFADERTRELTP